MMMKPDNLPYAVYTQERIDTGRPAMIVWGKSEKSVSNHFYKRFGVSAIKIFPAYFDEIEGKWVENREEIT